MIEIVSKNPPPSFLQYPKQNKVFYHPCFHTLPHTGARIPFLLTYFRKTSGVGGADSTISQAVTQRDPKICDDKKQRGKTGIYRKNMPSASVGSNELNVFSPLDRKSDYRRLQQLITLRQPSCSVAMACPSAPSARTEYSARSPAAAGDTVPARWLPCPTTAPPTSPTRQSTARCR
jgi:hypothetical protein